MPVDPTHKYVDTAHPSTKIGEDYRYGCWSTGRGFRKRISNISAPSHYIDLSGIRQHYTAQVVTEWKQINCGHTLEARATDRACRGCEYVTEQAEEVKQQDEIQSVQPSS